MYRCTYCVLLILIKSEKKAISWNSELYSLQCTIKITETDFIRPFWNCYPEHDMTPTDVSVRSPHQVRIRSGFDLSSRCFVHQIVPS
jgi:hypothetical protein